MTREEETKEILNNPEIMKAINNHKKRKGDYSDYIPAKDLKIEEDSKR